MIQPILIATALSGAYFITVPDRVRLGFALFLAADLGWMVVCVMDGQWWLAAQFAAFAVLAAKGWWGK
jgi:hypothetical protein